MKHSVRPHFMQKIRQAPMLTRDEERDLLARFRYGDPAACTRLVTSHLRYVLRIARLYRRHGIPIADLLQEGTLGLLEAIKRFNPDRGVRLSTYAMWWIRAAIQDHVVRSRSLVRVGTTAAQKSMFFNLRRLTGLTDAENIPEEVARAVAARFNTSVGEVVSFARRIARPDASLDDDSMDGETWLARLPDNAPNPEDRLSALREAKSRLIGLPKAIAGLPPRERHIIRCRFLADKRLSRTAVAAQLGLSKERVRQLEIRALAKLREIIQSNDGPSYGGAGQHA